MHELQKYLIQSLRTARKNDNVYYQRLLTFVIFDNKRVY